MDQNKKNIVWINNIRAICIIAVFFVHAQVKYGYFIPYLNDCLIHPFYVNAFFFVSGYLLFRKQLSPELISLNISDYYVLSRRTSISNIIFRLVIPSIIFALIEFFPKYTVSGEQWSFSELIFDTLGGGTYWFISALVVSELCIYAFLALRIKNIFFYFVCSVLLFMLGTYLINCNRSVTEDIWAYKKAFLSMVFLASGGLYFTYENKIHSLCSKYISVAILIVIYILAFTIYPSSKCLISMNELNIEGIIGSIAGIVLLILLCEKIKENNFLSFIGKNSIGFYLMSGAAPIVCSKLMLKLQPLTHFNDFVNMLIVFVVSMAIAYLGTYIITKYLPFLFDLRKMTKR